MKRTASIEQLIEYLKDRGFKYKISTIYLFNQKGIIPVLKHGKPVIYDLDAIDEWIENKLKK